MVPSFDTADLAFVGTITETTTNPDEITFDVEDVWKGATPWTTTVRVDTDPDSSFGGTPGPLPGEKWLVFATEEHAFSTCGWGSQPWSADLAQFRPADAHSRPSPPLLIFMFAVAIWATAGILTVALGSVNRRPRSTA